MNILLSSSLGPLFTIATLLTLTTKAQAQVLFRDNFTVSAQSLNINSELNGGRQAAGTLGPKAFVEKNQPDDFRTQVNEGTFPQSLFLLPTNSFQSPAIELLASPNFNFNTSGAHLTMSVVALTGSTMTTGDYIGFDVGANNPLDRSYDDSGFGILLRPHLTGVSGQANYQIFNGSTLLMQGNSAAIAQNRNALSIEIDAAAFNGTAAAVNLSINGISLFAGTIPGGFTNNYVTLGAANFGGSTSAYGFDDLQITGVPEPSTWIAGTLTAATLLCSRFRKRRA